MKKLIARIAALLLVGVLLIQPEYPDPVPETNDGGISILNLGDGDPPPKKN